MDPKKPPRTKSVRNRDGSKSTVRSTMTLEEYKASLEAPAKPVRPKPVVAESTPLRQVLPSGLALVRSRGENIPESLPDCSDCGRPYIQHIRKRDWMCDGYINPRLPRQSQTDPDIVESEDELDQLYAPPDEYEVMDWRVPDNLRADDEDDDVPSWLEAAGISRAEWVAQQQRSEDEAQRNREAQRLEAETEVELAHWREQIEKRPGA